MLLYKKLLFMTFFTTLVYSHWHLLQETAPDNQSGPCSPSPVSLPRPSPFPSPSLWLALVNFEPNISRINAPQLKSLVSLLCCTPMKMERIVSSETSALKAHAERFTQKNTIRRKFEIKIKSMSVSRKLSLLDNRVCVANWATCFDLNYGILRPLNGP